MKREARNPRLEIRIRARAKAWFVLAVLCVAGVVRAQDESRSRFPISGSHLPENPAATELLDAANAARSARRWDAAVRGYQEGLEQYADRVMPLDREVFVGVGAFCRKALWGLPPEGVAAYRSAFESRARSLLDRATRRGDAPGLLQVAERYPLCRAAREAEAMAARWALARGAFAEAASLLDTAVTRDSARELQLVPLLAGRALCALRLGDRPAFERLLALSKERIDLPPLLQGDRAVPLAEYLAGFSRGPWRDDPGSAAGADRAAVGAWPCPGGDSSGFRPMAELKEFPPRVRAVPVSEYNYNMNRTSRLIVQDPDVSEHGFMPVVPAISDGVVYLHNDITCWAYNGFSPAGSPLWTASTRLPPGMLPFEERVLHTLAVANGGVYVPLATSAEVADYRLSFLLVKFPRPYRALFALDAQDGRIRWRLGGDNTGTSFEERASFPMAPLVDGDRLYVGASYSLRPTDPIEHYVTCLDARTGAIRWSTYVSSGFLEINLFNNPLREPMGSTISKSGDTLVYCTNMGVVAGLDASTGWPRWIRKYRQYPIEPTRDPYNPQRLGFGWANNPPLIHEGTVYLTPMDSPYLYAIDLATGEERWRQELNANVGDWGGGDDVYRWVLGLRGGTLFLQGEDLLALDLQKQGKRKWPMPKDLKEARAEMLGRGMLAGEVIWLPTSQGLFRVDARSGKSLGIVPWPGGAESGGSLLHAEDLVCVSNRQMCTLFYSAEVADRRIAHDLESHPNDPFLHQRAGLLARTAGRPADAIRHFRRVVALTEGSVAPDRLSIRRNAHRFLFELLLAAAGESAPGADIEAVGKAFGEAVAAAPDTASEWEATRAFARACSARGQATRGVALLQSFLAAHRSDRVPTGPVRLAVKTEVAHLLEKAGRDAYAGTEKEAREMLAGAAEHPDRLDDVYALFPNSGAAEEAAIALALRLRAADRTEEVIALLQEFLQEYPDSARAAEACAILILVAESRGMWATARGLCQRLRRRWPDVPIEGVPPGPDGKPLTGGSFVDARLADPRYAVSEGGRDSPELPLPVDLLWQARAPQVSRLEVARPAGPPPPGAERFVYALTERKIQALSATDGKPAWEAGVGEAIRESAGFAPLGFCDRHLVCVTQQGATGLDAVSGEARWRCALGYYTTRCVFQGGMCYVLAFPRERLGELRLVAIDGQTGRRVWEQVLDIQQTGDFTATESHLLLRDALGEQVLVFDRDTGAPAGTIRVGKRAIDSVTPASPDKLCACDERGTLTMYGVPSGRPLWTHGTGGMVGATLMATPAVVAYLQAPSDPASNLRLMMLDAERGTVLSERDTGLREAPFDTFMDETRVALVYRFSGTHGRAAVGVYPVAAGGGWTTPVALGENTSFSSSPTPSRDALILSASRFDSTNRVGIPVEVIVPFAEGASCQSLTPPTAGRSSPVVQIVGGRLYVSHENRVFAYGRR
ncbi:MAG: PQQ-binding-like beta-propeller repeat protein [Planctomycetes bacterium]|nr:PQQ-binding-like beta-propeller repeat protein [Planctomycetota bacterium]